MWRSTSQLEPTAGPAIRRIAAIGAQRFQQPRSYRSQAGLTLVELLIVIGILTTLVAAAIPLLSPSGNDRRIREASRGVNVYISGAQAKAVALRRPYGVALKKLSQDTDNASDNGVCLEMYYVEQPPAFTGFDETSMVRISLDPDPEKVVRIQFVRRGTLDDPNADSLPAGLDLDPFPPDVIRKGDVLVAGGTEFIFTNGVKEVAGVPVDPLGFYQTPRDTNAFGELAARPANNTGQMLNFVDADLSSIVPYSSLPGYSGVTRQNIFYWTPPLPYKILRQPAPTAAEPYQLPQGTAIDLRSSGIRTNPTDGIPGGYFHQPYELNNATSVTDYSVNDNADPVMIMFTPEGSVERLIYNQANQNRATTNNNPEPDENFNEPIASNIYLLIGAREAIPGAQFAADETLDPSKVITWSETVMLEKTSVINWLNLDSRWVVIGAQSGRIVSNENTLVPLQNWSSSTSSHAYKQGTTTNLQRRTWQIWGAREFAREMSQSGGG